MRPLPRLEDLSPDTLSALVALREDDESRGTLLRLSTSWPPFDLDPELARLVTLGLLETSADPERDRLVLSPRGREVAALLLAEAEIPRLAYGTIDGTRVRLWGDVDGSAASLGGVPHYRLWRVHEVRPDLLPTFVLMRGMPDATSLEEAARILDITLEPKPA